VKHILRIGLAVVLVAAMLGCVAPVYAADGEDGSGLKVDVTVVGDDSDVGVDLYGDDNTANVTFHSENPTVNINGQNLSTYSGSGAASVMGVRRLVKDVMYPYMNDIWNGLNLTADGLAKVIQLSQANESELESQSSLVDTHGDKLTTLESAATGLGERVDALEAQDAALEAQDAAIQAQITANVSYIIDSYNRLLTIIIGAFALVVIGLGTGLFLLWRRTL